MYCTSFRYHIITVNSDHIFVVTLCCTMHVSVFSVKSAANSFERYKPNNDRLREWIGGEFKHKVYGCCTEMIGYISVHFRDHEECFISVNLIPFYSRDYTVIFLASILNQDACCGREDGLCLKGHAWMKYSRNKEYWWFNVRLQYLQCVSNRDIAVLH